MVKVGYCGGHSFYTAGKRSPNDEREWSFNNKVVLAFEKEMKKYKNIQLLRTDDPVGYVDVPLETRVKIANDWGADIYISFHHNAFKGVWGTHTGIETFYHRGSELGYKLARAVHNQVREAYNLRDRGLKVNSLYITRETNEVGIPAILVEGGFMDSTIDILKLRDDKVLEQAGIRAAHGVLEYFNIPVIDKGEKNLILSKPTATVAQMQEWARQKKANQQFIDLAPIFYEVSVKIGVNPIITYTQSAKETGYMRFGGVLDASYKNPCGLKTTAGGGNYDPSAHQRFNSWEEGIQAQVDHLALYAGHSDYPKLDSPDPRHFPYIRGTAPNVEDLGGKWAPSKSYGTDIVRMMRELEDIVSEEIGVVESEFDIIKVLLHGKLIEIEGIYKNDTNYIPIRFLENLGYQIGWENETVFIDYKEDK